MRTFQQSFFMGRAFIAIFKNSACQNGIFAICSLRMLLGHYKRKLQYLQTVQNYHKELPRLSGIIRVHSGRTERTSPITSERFSPQKPMQAHFPAGAAAAAAHSRPIKTVSRFYARQYPERRTDYQIPPDQAAMFRGSYTAGSVAFLLLSTTLPAFCLRIFP